MTDNVYSHSEGAHHHEVRCDRFCDERLRPCAGKGHDITGNWFVGGSVDGIKDVWKHSPAAMVFILKHMSLDILVYHYGEGGHILVPAKLINGSVAIELSLAT